MKTLLSLTAIVLSLKIYGQVPQTIKYQTVVRDAAGVILRNQSVDFRISIPGTNYQDLFTATTNEFGLISLNIGSGADSVDFKNISWANGSYSFKIELDSLGIKWVTLGETPFSSVPYALYAETTDKYIAGTGIDISGNIVSNTGDTSNVNEFQNLSSSVSGSNVTINISNGAPTTFSIAGSGTNQTLSLNGDTLSISNGNSVILPTYSSTSQGIAKTYLTQPMGTEVSANSFNIDDDTTMHLGMVIIPYSITVNKISVSTGLPTVAGTLDISIYSEEGQQLVTLTTSSITIQGVVSTSISSITLSPGNYYFAVNGNGATNLTYPARNVAISSYNSPVGEPVYAGTMTILAGTPPTAFDPTTIVVGSGRVPVIRLDN